MISEEKIKEFWSRVKRSSSTKDCWEWDGDENRPFNLGIQLPYRFSDTSGEIPKRVAYILTHGLSSLTPRTRVFNTCRNSACCNPAHLTIQHPGNLKRTARHLSDADIENIKWDPRLLRDIANEHGVTVNVIAVIKATGERPLL